MLRMSAFKFVIATTIGLLLIASSASAGTIDPFTVYVGYADNLRASGFFPNPWIGVMFNGQSVTSQTNPAGMSFDAGAVRIDNGTTSMTITNFEVTDNNGSVLFAIWGALTLAPGQTGVFTQTASYNFAGVEVLTRSLGEQSALNPAPAQTGVFTQTASYNFDSSDQGLFGGAPPANLEPNNADGNGNTNLIGGCSSNPSFYTSAQASGPCNVINAPVISFTENGNNVSFIDTGFIINTGEWDFVNNASYGEDGNESINWNVLGGTSRGGSTPEPGTLLTMAGPLACIGLLLRKRLLKRKS